MSFLGEWTAATVAGGSTPLHRMILGMGGSIWWGGLGVGLEVEAIGVSWDRCGWEGYGVEFEGWVGSRD